MKRGDSWTGDEAVLTCPHTGDVRVVEWCFFVVEWCELKNSSRSRLCSTNLPTLDNSLLAEGQEGGYPNMSSSPEGNQTLFKGPHTANQIQNGPDNMRVRPDD